MCLAVPGRVTELLGDGRLEALVDMGGVRRRVSLLLVQDQTVAEGDWVLVHVGFALNKLDEAEAERTQALLAEIAGEEPPGEGAP
jgi:hydrogenase expression/formation protein HypC